MIINKIMKSKKIAAIISYITTILSAAASLILIPVCLKYVGSDQYGLYQKIYAVIQYLLIIDLGISSAVIRYAVSARTSNDIELEWRVYGFMFKITCGLNIVIISLGILMYCFIDVIYNSMSLAETKKARQLLIIMILHSVFVIFQDYLNGITETHEHFVFSKNMKMIRISSRLILIPFFIILTRDIAAIAYVDLGIIIVTTMAIIIYNTSSLKARLSFHTIDKAITKGATALMFACLLQNTSKFLNNGIDKILLGRLIGNEAVTTYSISMTFISFYMIISTVIQNVHLPQIVKMNTEGASIEQLTDVVVKVGRIQLILCGGFLSGFIVLGKDFINIWAGSGHEDAYFISIIIMIPLIVPLIQNVCLSILTAKDKRLFRSIVVVCLSITNVILTIVLINQIGLLGAPVGTAIAYLLGNIIAMNIYYSKEIGIRVMNMFSRIIDKIIICIVVTFVISFISFRFLPSSTLWWILKAIFYLMLYGLLLMIYGFNENEKKYAIKIKNKIMR